MRIKNLRPMGAGSVVARFDLAVDDDLTLFNLSLKRNTAGHYRVYPPSGQGKALASMSPALAMTITEAAIAALGGERLAAAA